MGPKRAIAKPKVNDDDNKALQNNNLEDARRLGLYEDHFIQLDKSKKRTKSNKEVKKSSDKKSKTTSSTTNERK